MTVPFGAATAFAGVRTTNTFLESYAAARDGD